MVQSRKLKRSEQLEPSSRYELVLRLAAGGMGAVYVGRPRAGDPGRPLVAVKRAHAHLLEDPTFRKMFVAEARLAARIRHANVVGVTDVDESDGELLIVMDYVEGASFAELLAASQRASRRLPAAVAIRIVLDAARGLHAAHSTSVGGGARDHDGRLLGIVHRDVSPHNVLVGADGVARIVDFGVAKAIDHEGTNTQSGILKGKAAYMAPEYLKGKVASPASDVFSMAVVAWEGLTCKRLFRTDDEVETMQRILDDTPAPLVSDVMFVDPSIDAVVARALEKDPARRYPSACAFADALEAAARAQELLATPAEVGVAMETLLGAELEGRRAMVEEALEALGERTISRRRTARMPSVPSTAAQREQAFGALPSVGEPPAAPPPSAAPQPTAAWSPPAAPAQTVRWQGPPSPGPTGPALSSAPTGPAYPPAAASTYSQAPLPHPLAPVFVATPARLSRRPSQRAVTTTLPTVPIVAPRSAASGRALPLAILGALAVVGAVALGFIALRESPAPASPASAEPSPSAPSRDQSPSLTSTPRVAASDGSAPLVLDASSASDVEEPAPGGSARSSASSGASTAQPVGARTPPTPAKSTDPRRTTFTPRQNPY